MATGAAIGLGVLGAGFQFAGILGGASQAAEDARVAEEFANRQYDLQTSNLRGNYLNTIRQSRESTRFGLESQQSSYDLLLGNARSSAALQSGQAEEQREFAETGVEFQRQGQVQQASQQGTRIASGTRAAQAVSGAGGGSSNIVSQQRREESLLQQGAITAQAEISREGIALSEEQRQEQISLGLETTEATATERLEQGQEALRLRQSQTERSADIAFAQGMSQAELQQYAALYGIPTGGEIAGEAALDLLATGADFGSYLLDIYGD